MYNQPHSPPLSAFHGATAHLPLLVRHHLPFCLGISTLAALCAWNHVEFVTVGPAYFKLISRGQYSQCLAIQLCRSEFSHYLKLYTSPLCEYDLYIF